MLVVAMSCVVKLFNTQQNFYKTLGFDIFLSQSCHSKCLASAKILFFLISSTQLFISTTAYFLFQAQTADEYEISFYISITIFITVINISTIAWKIRKFLTIIERYEDFIDKSQFSICLLNSTIFIFFILFFVFRIRIEALSNFISHLHEIE